MSLLFQTSNRGLKGFCDHKIVIIILTCLLMVETILLYSLQKTSNKLGTQIKFS